MIIFKQTKTKPKKQHMSLQQHAICTYLGTTFFGNYIQEGFGVVIKLARIVLMMILCEYRYLDY